MILTDKGKQTFDAAMRLQAPWVDRLSEGLSIKDLQTFNRVINSLREVLERSGTEERA